MLAAAAWGLVWFGGFAGALPSPATLTSRQVFQTMPVMASDGATVLYEITDPQGGRRTVVPIGDIPRVVVEATIATEDAGFFSNPGFELRSILRAGFDDLTHKQIVSGASTITQQVVRNVLLSPADQADVSARRKIKEIVVAYQVTQTYTKDDILEIYLNEINYGNRNYGIEAAAEGYFGIPAANLDLAQAAMLAGIPQAPSFYDPFIRLQDVMDRQAYILGRMVEQGYITDQEAADAAAEDVRLVVDPHPAVAPHFVNFVSDGLVQSMGSDRLYHAGGEVITSLDPTIQQIVDRQVAANLDALKGAGGNNVAVVALDPANGDILAMVGSAAYDDASIAGEVNMALAPRQSGGILTPATYALALQHGLTLASPLDDSSANTTAIDTSSGVDATAARQKAVAPTLREALARGLQRPASSVMRLVSNQGFIDLAGAIGLDSISSRVDLGVDGTIAGARVSPLEVAQVYATLANEGTALTPVAVKRILDHGDNIIDEAHPSPHQVLDPGVAYLVTSVLVGAPLTTADARPILDANSQVAGHSAISDDGHDGWVAGYVGNLVVVVWTGSGNQHLRDLDPALQIWSGIFRDALKARPASDYSVPSNVVELSLCKNAACSSRRTELALSGTEAIVQAANAVVVAVPQRAIVNSLTPLLNRDQNGTAAPAAAPDVLASTAVASNGGVVTVPNVSGTTPQLGRDRLVGAGLRVALDPKYVTAAEIPRGTPVVPVGQIVATTPASGQSVPSGTQVTLVVRRS